jgi:2-dehydro-3-deoxygluconokinase
MSENRMKMDVLCLGEALIEFNQIPDDTNNIYRSGFGGDTSNTAIAVARQETSSGFLSKVGNDLFGRKLLELWKREGVDCTYVLQHPEFPTGIYFVTHDENGHHFSYYRKGSAASQMTPEDVTVAISDSSCETAFAAIHQARKRGVKISYDTNLRLKLWTLIQARDVINHVVPMCDVLLPSLDDVTSLTGLREPKEIIDYYLKLGAKLVVLKQGEQGVLVADGNNECYISGHAVKAIDATGAGDTFDGAFLSEWLRSDDPFAAAEYANAAAALSTTSYGAVDSIPNREDVAAFLGRTKHS